MVVDASVWVAAFLGGDVHHRTASAFLHQLVLKERIVTLPLLVIPEVAGALGRQTGNASIAEKAILFMRSKPWIQFVQFRDDDADIAAVLAARQRLRGADAVYAGLAARQHAPLVTLDREMLERTTGIIESMTPENWLQAL